MSDAPDQDQDLSDRYAPSPRRGFPQFQIRPQWWNWTGLKRAIDKRIVSHGDEVVGTEVLRGLRYFWIDGVFASLSDNIIVSFLSLFALAYGATNGQIGALTSVANLFAVIALFPGATHADRATHRKRLVIWTGGVWGRLLIVPLVLVPLFSIGAQPAIWIIILVNGARNFLNSYANPAWTGLVADLVPVERRSRYFSERSFTMGLAALTVSVLGGVIIRRLGIHSGNPYLGYQIVFAGALIFGSLSTISFSRIPEPGRATRESSGPGKEAILSALKSNPIFVGFLVGALIWNLSIQMAGPFFNVFLVTRLGGTAETVGLAAGVSTISGLLGLIVFGRFTHRRGNLAAIRVTGPFIPLLPVLWGLSTRSWHVFIIVTIGGFVWAGFNLANFNLLLELAPRKARSMSVALYQAVVFSSAVIGPMIGGALIDLFSYRSVFIGTGVGRMIGVVLFIVLMRRHRPERPAST